MLIHISVIIAQKISWPKISCKKKQRTNITSQTSISVCSWCGSRLERMVPSKSVGSWGMILNRERKSCNPIVVTSRPSTIILPLVGSTILNIAWMSVDLPLPVRPTTPIFCPPWNVHVIPCNTNGEWGLYRIWTPKKKKHKEITQYTTPHYIKV